MDRYSFDVENFHLLSHAGLSRRSEWVASLARPRPRATDTSREPPTTLVASDQQRKRSGLNARRTTARLDPAAFMQAVAARTAHRVPELLFFRTHPQCRPTAAPPCRKSTARNTYQSAGTLDQAIPLYEQTLADRERVLGPEHPDTLTTRNNLAYAYQSAGGSTGRSRSMSRPSPTASGSWAPSTPTP